MRKLVWQYLEGNLSRRGFLQGLVAAGLTTSAARSFAEAAERGEEKTPGAPDTAPAYSFSGTGADLLAEQIKAAGTRFLFTNPGSVEVAFFDALTDRNELQIIMGLHEGVVLSMADGYHKVSGEPAFVNVHAVAGTGQIGGQMFNAHRDGSGIFITAGLSDITNFSDDLHLAPSAGFNQTDINQQFTKMSWEVRNGATCAVAARRAYKLTAAAPGGPVYVGYSRDALSAKVSGEIWPKESFMIDARPRPAADKLEALARMLIEAERPTIVFGDEVWKSGAQAKAVELTELLGLAAATAQQALQNFPTHHPQYIGRIRRGEAYPFGNQDLIVQMGARDPGGMQIPDVIRMAPLYVAVGMDTEMMGRTHPVDLAIVADVDTALAELIDAVKSLATAERLEQIRSSRLAVVTAAAAERRARLEQDEARRNFDNATIHPDRLDYELNQAIHPNAIVASENLTGKSNFMNFGYRDDQKMHLGSNGTSLGRGIGNAIGAQIAAPDRQVVVSIGDGSTMYSSSGFWTMARYEVPVLTIVWNNRNYQTVRHGFHRYGGRMAETGHYHGMNLTNPNIDYVGLAASQGVSGERVESPSELATALKRGSQTTLDGKPYLVEVLIDKYGGGAESTWYHDYSVVAERKRRA